MHFLSCKQHHCAGSVANLSPDFFDPSHHQIQAQAQGRGTAWFFQYQHNDYVLRHFRRGGFFAKYLQDYYFYCGLYLTRSYREWQLLDYLHQRGLPAPQPIAYHVFKHCLFYQADIVTRQIPNSQPLSSYLQTQALTTQLWQQLGQVICQFHDVGVYHADLNAHNILIDDKDKLWLIDFDRGRLTNMTPRRRRNNLNRLRRSLEKLRQQHAGFHYSDEDFQSVLLGGD